MNFLETHSFMISISSHLFELKLRCFYLIFSGITLFFVCWNFQVEMVYLFGRPFVQLNQPFIFLELPEAFYTLVKISLSVTFFFLLPLAFYHFWCFFIPSFYQIERSKVTRVSLIVLIALGSEILWIYFWLLPHLVEFLLNFQVTSPPIGSSIEFSKHFGVRVEFTARIASYVTLIIKVITCVLFFFQIPFCVCFLYSKNILKVSVFYLNRRYLVGISLGVSALIVPPDILSQLGLSLVFFFFFLNC